MSSDGCQDRGEDDLPNNGMAMTRESGPQCQRRQATGQQDGATKLDQHEPWTVEDKVQGSELAHRD